MEKGLDGTVVRRIAEIGYTVKTVGGIGCTQSIVRAGGLLYGAADMHPSLLCYAQANRAQCC